MTASPSGDIRVLIIADAGRVGPLVEALATQEDIRIVGIASAPPQGGGGSQRCSRPGRRHPM